MLAKQIQDIIDRKERIINRYRNAVVEWTTDFQMDIFSNLISKKISNLDTENGVILDTYNNKTIIAEINSFFKQMEDSSFPELVGSVSEGTNKLGLLNDEYFTMTFTGIGKRMDISLNNAKKVLEWRLGLKNGELIRNGWMETLLKDTTVLRNVKDALLKSVIGGAKMKDTIETLRKIIVGTKDENGGYEKYMKNSVYDVFQQYNAAYAEQIAKDLDLKYFYYAGGLVSDSRDFCREHNGRVWTTDEAKQWENWTPSKAKFITTFEQKNIYAVPSYLGYAGYDPLIDRGGYNCRHQLAYIPEEMAFDDRPDLKESE